MPDNQFHIVDVFAREKYAGNQLAVFHDAKSLTDAEMQRLTRETNFSEATFIESTDAENGGYDVRIFDPVEEIPFAGHPTLGTAYVIREYVCEDRPDELALNLGVGRVPVRVQRDGGEERFWMRQIPPSFEDAFDRELAARVLNLDESDIDDASPVQLVSTGLPTVVVPLRSLDALQRAETNLDPYYEELIGPYGNLNLLAFAPDAREDGDLSVRVFADCGGVPEDPATGSSNGCLAAYLVKHRHFDADEIDVSVEQGYEMGRPSVLYLRASRAEGGIEVHVGGRVIPVAGGALL